MIRSRSGLGWAVALVLPIVAVSACSSNRDVFVGQDCAQGFCNDDIGFVSPDAGADVAVVTPPEDGPMCPVTTCSPPRATCPTSEFPCDVDLSSDNENCGGCGIRCGTGVYSNWRCVEGQCTFACGVAPLGGNQGSDCDNDPTNGCEVDTLFDNNNCGACGYACPAGKSCTLGECFSMCDLMGRYYGMPDSCGDFVCTNFNYDDANCGGCGNVCDPTGPDLPALPSDMHYGCLGAKCGGSKCNDPSKANCNGDKSDGCEATLHTNEHCGYCGDTCAPGKQCLKGDGNVYRCACEDDSETLCGEKCQILDQDPTNCGACNNVCPGTFSPHYAATCTKGVCGGQCETGYADCDALPENGCEIDVRIDSRHCGACGSACAPGQVCAEGKCLVAPCEGGPETTAK